MQPYPRQPLDIAFGVLCMASIVAWASSLALLIGDLGGSHISFWLFNFALTASATTTASTFVIWGTQRVCGWAAAGRVNLLDSLDARVDAKIEAMKWESFSDVCDTILCENDPTEGGGANSVQ